jgi:hypothetical protein
MFGYEEELQDEIKDLKEQIAKMYTEKEIDHLFSYIDSKSYHLDENTMFVVKSSDLKKAFKKFKK